QDEADVERDPDREGAGEIAVPVVVIMVGMAGAHARALAEGSVETQMRLVERTPHFTECSSCDNVSLALGRRRFPRSEHHENPICAARDSRCRHSQYPCHRAAGVTP